MKQLFDIGVKVILATAIVILFVLQQQSNDSTVYVDAQKLVAGYKGMQAARKEYENKAVAWKANLDTLRGEVENDIRAYEAKKPKLSASEKKLTEELIQVKQQQFMNYQQAIKEKAQKEDQELSMKVLEKVNDYIKKFGKDKGYRIIHAATQYGNIVYAQEGIDITQEVLKGLNAEYN